MVDRLCTSLGGLSLSAIRRYTALAAEREDCITLTIGEPDLPTPAPICEAAVRALAGGIKYHRQAFHQALNDCDHSVHRRRYQLWKCIGDACNESGH